MRVARWFVLVLMSCGCAVAQGVAPTARCDFHGARMDAPIRQITGQSPVPYWFACGVRKGAACIAGSLPVGLVVSVDREDGPWTCVTGGDSSSGWVETARLEAVPDEPKIPQSLWVGWWRNGAVTDDMADGGDVLLLTPGSAPGSIRVSGKAIWYGAIVDGQHVEHFGRVNGEGVPVGRHLHIVQAASGVEGNGCVLDLTIDTKGKTPVLDAYDNEQCGGMNVRFGGAWTRFTPRAKKKM